MLADSLMQLPDPEQEVRLEGGMKFNSFEEAEVWIKSYAKQQHFVVTKTRLKHDKEGQLRKRTFQCDRSVKRGRHRKQVIGNSKPRNNTRTKRCECPWHLNLAKRGAVVRISTILDEHNHECNTATDHFACVNRQLTENMKDLICYFTVHGHLDAGAQMALLKGKFPDW